VRGTIQLDQVANEQVGHSELTTGTDGQFAFARVPAHVVYRVQAAGCLDRQSTWAVTEDRSALAVELICESPRLSLDFYRTFVRNLRDSTSGPMFLRPLTEPPRFYVRTVLEDTGETVPAAIVTGLRRVFENSVDELSGGRLHMASFETGTLTRSPEPGLVRVGFRHFVDDFTAGETVCLGSSGIAVTLIYDPRFDTDDIKAMNYAANCESITVGVAEHEIVHVMGFDHTETTPQDFQTTDCSGHGRPQRVRDAARVMYSRPFGNKDPDLDPPAFIAPARVSDHGNRTICPWSLIR
jgi:hypothetical protein